MSTRRIAIAVQGAALAFACLLVPGAAHAVIFDDGMLHIIDAANSLPVQGRRCAGWAWSVHRPPLNSSLAVWWAKISRPFGMSIAGRGL